MQNVDKSVSVEIRQTFFHEFGMLHRTKNLVPKYQIICRKFAKSNFTRIWTPRSGGYKKE
uniref:Uncharacterized protein n=1 Tax=Romanomermis culicivorax TaxID=13658 RepID=A0A915LBE0_ROMCU